MFGLDAAVEISFFMSQIVSTHYHVLMSIPPKHHSTHRMDNCLSRQEMLPITDVWSPQRFQVYYFPMELESPS